MSQADLIVADQNFAPFRADLNLQLAALSSRQQGSSAPSTTFAYMPWLDTSATPWIMKIRNAANDAWIEQFRIDDSDDTVSLDADNVDIADAGAHYVGTEVEAALQEAAVITQGQETIWIPAGAMVPRVTDGAILTSLESSSNLQMAQTMDFDPSTQQFAQFSFQLPKSYNLGTLIAQAVWRHPTTTVNFGVVFDISGRAFGNSDPLDASKGTPQQMADIGGTTDDIFLSPESSAITLAGSPGAEDWVNFEVSRDVLDGSDDLAVSAGLLGIRLHYTTNQNNDD